MISREQLVALARRYGTPLFVYDGDLMLERYRDLFRFIPADCLRIHYALKANYNPALLTLLREAGAGIDAVSPAEVLLALELGFAKDRIIYTANNMTDAEFARVMRTGVTVNIGSLSRLKQQVNKNTREDHRTVMDAMIKLYAQYKETVEKQSMGFKMSAWDEKLLKYGAAFEREMMDLSVNIPLEDALDLGWRILADCFDRSEVGIPTKLSDRFWPKG